MCGRYKFEATLLSQYQEDFSSYTLKQFIRDYVTPPRERATLPAAEQADG